MPFVTFDLRMVSPSSGNWGRCGLAVPAFLGARGGEGAGAEGGAKGADCPTPYSAAAGTTSSAIRSITSPISAAVG